MNRISTYLSDDHRHCDEHFSSAENAVAEQQWPKATAYFGQFKRAMQIHFEREESILFPAFEAHTGMKMGPTQIMRAEHADMNDLLEQMQASLAAQQQERFLGQSETLLMLMQQHNIKEEQILYPMSDRTLAAEAETLVAAMLAVGETQDA